MKRVRLTIMLFAAALVAVSTVHAADLMGKEAPAFTLKTADGHETSLAEALKKGPVLVDFWATWCQPCKQALVPLSKIYDTYKDQGFTLLAISVDNTRSVSKIRPYIRSKGYDFPVLLDTDSEVLRQYGGTNIPHSVLIAPDGTIHKIWIGYQPGEEREVEKEVKALLASKEADK